MALITQTATQVTQTQVESMGSLKLILMPLTTGSTNDTFQLGTNLPIVQMSLEGNSTTTAQPYTGDASYVASTGLVTLISQYYGSADLIIWMRT